MLSLFKRVRTLRQKPAHSIRNNEFDQKYVHEQRDLMRSVYHAVKVLRVVLGFHPDASNIKINRHLENELIWSI